MTSNHSNRSWAFLVHPLIPILLRSNHLSFGLPAFIFRSSFVSDTILKILLLSVLIKWPSHSSLLNFMSVVVSVFRYKLFSSSRVPIHQIPLSPAGPQLFLSIFLSQVTKTVVARSCTTIGLINVLYVLILTFFDVYLAFIVPLRACTQRLPEAFFLSPLPRYRYTWRPNQNV